MKQKSFDMQFDCHVCFMGDMDGRRGGGFKKPDGTVLDSGRREHLIEGLWL